VKLIIIIRLLIQFGHTGISDIDQALRLYSFICDNQLDIARESRAKRRKRGATRALRCALRVVAAQVELHIKRPRELFVPFLLLASRTRALLFQMLQLTRRPLVRILAFVPPRACSRWGWGDGRARLQR